MHVLCFCVVVGRSGRQTGRRWSYLTKSGRFYPYFGGAVAYPAAINNNTFTWGRRREKSQNIIVIRERESGGRSGNNNNRNSSSVLCYGQRRNVTTLDNSQTMTKVSLSLIFDVTRLPSNYFPYAGCVCICVGLQPGRTRITMRIYLPNSNKSAARFISKPQNSRSTETPMHGVGFGLYFKKPPAGI